MYLKYPVIIAPFKAPVARPKPGDDSFIQQLILENQQDIRRGVALMGKRMIKKLIFLKDKGIELEPTELGIDMWDLDF